MPVRPGRCRARAARCRHDWRLMVASGHTVLLVHAFGSSGRAWAPQVAGLGDRYRVIAPDLPGHGDAAGPFTLTAPSSLCARVWRRGRARASRRHSGGATVALLTYLEIPARREPGAVRRRSSRSAAGLVAARDPARAARAGARAALAWLVLGRPARVRARRGRGFPPLWKADLPRWAEELAHVDLRGQARRGRGADAGCLGARDRANLGPSREIAAGVPGAELRIVPDAVHLWNLQQPELFNETVAGSTRTSAVNRDSVVRPDSYFRKPPLCREGVAFLLLLRQRSRAAFQGFCRST